MGTRSFPEVKQLGFGVDHPPPSSAEVKERVELHLNSPSGPSWHVLGWTLPLPLPYSSIMADSSGYTLHMLFLTGNGGVLRVLSGSRGCILHIHICSSGQEALPESDQSHKSCIPVWSCRLWYCFPNPSINWHIGLLSVKFCKSLR